MKKNKRYNDQRLGILKNLSQNFDTEKRASQGYEERSLVSMPLMEGHFRSDPWVLWLRKKIELSEL